jgi:hypothetical protein
MFAAANPVPSPDSHRSFSHQTPIVASFAFRIAPDSPFACRSSNWQFRTEDQPAQIFACFIYRFSDFSDRLRDESVFFAVVYSHQFEKSAFRDCFLPINFVILPIFGFESFTDQILNAIVQNLNLVTLASEKSRGLDRANASSAGPPLCCELWRQLSGLNYEIAVLVSSLLFSALAIAIIRQVFDQLLSFVQDILSVMNECFVFVSSTEDVFIDRNQRSALCLYDSVRFGITTVNLFRLRGGSNQDFDIVGSRLLRYRGSSRSVVIPKCIEVLGALCFSGKLNKSSAFETITFEHGSRLSRIEESCFSHCALKLICIPRNVEILSRLCFFSWAA